MDLDYLGPKIYAILSAPAVDLSTISAKRVRKQLIADGEPEDLLRTRKAEVDAIIAQIYETVNNPTSNGHGGHDGALPHGGNGGSGADYTRSSPPPAAHKRKRSPSPAPEYNFQSSQPQPLHDVTKRGAGGSGSSRGGSHAKTDAELARQLSFELNGRSTRAGASSNGGSRNTTPKNKKAKANGKKASATKSKATIDSDEDGASHEDGASRPKKKARGGGGGGGFQKEYVLSAALADMVGQTMLSRPQAVKKIWEHIKENKLQDPSDKREIMCDDPLKAIFRTERLNMFKMNKLLGDHLMEPGEQVK